MDRNRPTYRLLFAATMLIGARAASSQTLPGWGRVFIFGNAENTTYTDGTRRDFNEVTASFRLRSPVAQGDGFEYSFDVRSSAYPGVVGQTTRTNIYDAWLAGKMLGGALSVRAGQMWLNDLGALGSVGGLMIEARGPQTAAGRFRFGVFGGREPKDFQTGYVSGVKKGGAWMALDGAPNRHDVLGYVLIKDASLTERSVLTTTNFLPLGKHLFVYQAAEYDLKGPGGMGKGGLNYIFANARFTPVQAIEILAIYHRGRSIDARTITQDILNGRPVDQKSLDGFLFESAGGRITVSLMRNLRVYGGYSRDRNNYDSRATGRFTAGLWASNVARTGLDFTASANHFLQPGGNYNSWYASLGRSLGRSLYLSADYSTSLSVIQIAGSGGVMIETRPRTKRYSLNAVWNMNRWISLLGTVEQLRDNTSKDDRGMFGISFRF